jgi:predicted nucleic acid-binding protein
MKPCFVLDNSVVMRWFFGDGTANDLEYAMRVLDAMTTSTALVPAVWSLEVANVIARAEAKKLVTEADSEAFIAMLEKLDICVSPGKTTEKIAGEALQLARRYALSSYDASYLNLALHENLPLATLDSDLLGAARQAGVRSFLKC